MWGESGERVGSRSAGGGHGEPGPGLVAPRRGLLGVRPTQAGSLPQSTGALGAEATKSSPQKSRDCHSDASCSSSSSGHPHLRPIWLPIGGSPDPVLRSDYLLGWLSALREPLPRVYQFIKGYRWTARWRELQGTVCGRVQSTAARWVPPSHRLCTHRAPAGGQTLGIAWRVHHTGVMDL